MPDSAIFGLGKVTVLRAGGATVPFEQLVQMMIWAARGLSAIVCLAISCTALQGQEHSEKINANFGGVGSVPLHPMGIYTSAGWGLTGGAGYNFKRRHSAIGEFLWTRLPATEAALGPIRDATGAASLSGHSNLYVVTGNYRYEWRGRRFGAYAIGGGGLYYRTTNPSVRIDSGSNTSCTPPWLWWGFQCASGVVIAGQRHGSTGSNAFGGNVGIGFTARVAEEPYRLYFESRYHYAPQKNISTQLVTVGVGIRY